MRKTIVFSLCCCFQLEQQPNIDLGQDYERIYTVLGGKHQFIISYVYFKVQAKQQHVVIRKTDLKNIMYILFRGIRARKVKRIPAENRENR